ncbi:hypothetical protein Taro_054034 [Colocasia esculenta]|uniref:Retrotransposon gag domain-containing protein n=1 Tax=Colocasia esculenta TaxID=4460 RepID=A0A843XMN8_COLES|nr:hypothetical protein [Colocasia esculenta]
MASRGGHGVPTREGEQRRDEPRHEDQGFSAGHTDAGPHPGCTPGSAGGLAGSGSGASSPGSGPWWTLHHGMVQEDVATSFKGESDPLLAESWMREIEKIFWAIRCAEDDKVTLATYMLQERADVWWSSMLRTRFKDDVVEIAWDELVAFDHRTLEQALSAACRQEGEMEQYLEEKKREGVSSLREDTRWYRMLEVGGEVLEVREQRAQDQGLSQTSAGSPAWSDPTTSSSSSSASDSLKSELLKHCPAFYCNGRLEGSSRKASPTFPCCGDHPRAPRKEILEDIPSLLGTAQGGLLRAFRSIGAIS